MSIKNFTNRADLLRWYQYHSFDSEIELKTAQLLGYEYHPPNKEYLIPTIKTTKDEPIEISEQQLDISLQYTSEKASPSYYYLTERQVYNQDKKRSLPMALQGCASLTKSELYPLKKSQPIVYVGITNKIKMHSFLQKKLRQLEGKQPDIARLIKSLVEQKPLSKMPIKTHISPIGRVTILLDLCDRLLPFWRDSHQVCEMIRQKHGKLGQDIRILNTLQIEGDYQYYTDVLKKQLHVQRWKTIPTQSAVFIISDAGQLSLDDSDIRKQWLVLLQRLKKQGISPIIIAPIAPEQQCPVVQSLSYQVLWHPNSEYHPQKRTTNKQLHQQKVERIIAFLSLSPHIEPELLRHLIKNVLGSENSGIEADIYLHSDIQWGYQSINVRLEKREFYQQQLKKEAPEQQRQLLEQIKQHHIGQFPAVWYETLLNAEHIVNFSLDQYENIQIAKTYMKRLAVTGLHNRQHQGLKNYFKRHLERCNLQQKQANKDSYPSIYYALSLHKTNKSIPNEYNAAIVQQTLEQKDSPSSSLWQLIQNGKQLFIQKKPVKDTENTMKKARVLVIFSSPYTNIRVGQQIFILNEKNPVRLVNIEQKILTFTLDTGKEKLTISSIKKPTWAKYLTQLQNYLVATLYFSGKKYQLVLKQLTHYKTNENSSLQWEILGNTESLGFDEYGLYAFLIVKKNQQLFRWIEPGTFLMGSAKNERGRYRHETQHQVTLSRGFWMADTAVTQAFWQAIMGENPSYFQLKDQVLATRIEPAIESPVENVSWNDCQQFINKLKQHFKQLNCHLPSDAQWEYAARAGKQKIFNFQGDLNLNKANYNGNNHWGKDNIPAITVQCTKPVMSYPSNHWGLYEMHGNVWEWCQDNWQSDLGTTFQIDPKIENKSTKRVVRGGSWKSSAEEIRSAIRYYNEADDISNFIGLRLIIS